MGRGNVFSSRLAVRQRVGLLDEIRGLCIILMVLYHAAFMVLFVFGWDITIGDEDFRLLSFVYFSPPLRLAQPFVAGIFVFISGIVCRYSRGNLKRGIIALGLAVAISTATIFLLEGMSFPVYFGILHLLGSSMVIFALTRPALDKLVPGLGLLIMLLLFAFTYSIPRQNLLGIPGVWTAEIPDMLGEISWLLPLGFAPAGADYFPLLPWLFLFLAGSYLGVAFINGDMPRFVYRTRSRALSAIGRRAILVYILHQPILFGLMFGISAAVAFFRG